MLLNGVQTELQKQYCFLTEEPKTELKILKKLHIVSNV
jgi:hypothetical protein